MPEPSRPLARGFARLPDITGDPRACPPTRGRAGIGKTRWWQGVKDGAYPPSTQLSPRTTGWRIAYLDIWEDMGCAHWEREIMPLVDADTTGRYDALRELLVTDYGAERYADIVATAMREAAA